MTKTVLWLFGIFLGITFGAGLYESRVVVSKWTTAPDGTAMWDAEAARRDDTGRKFWVFVTTGPLTLVTLISLVLAWRAAGPLRTWWLAAAATALIDRILMFSYFIPTMVRLMDAGNTPAAREAAARWANLDYVRHVMVLVAWLLALKAFSLYYDTRRSRKSPG
jgi:putative effector of murein hydrolase LrgA (UPF0299 family)